MDSAYGFTGKGSHGIDAHRGNAFVLAGITDTGKPILRPVQLNRKADTLHLPRAQKTKKRGIVSKSGAIAKGFGKAAIETLSNMLSIKGMLIAAATIGVAALAGPAVIPFMVAAGLLTGGVQMAKGYKSGNWEGVGAGLFTVGSSMLGSKFAPKTARNLSGEELRLASNTPGWLNQLPLPKLITGMIDGTKNQLRLVLGGKVTNPARPEQPTNIYQLVRENTRSNWKNFKQQAASMKESQTRFQGRIDEISQANPRLKETIQTTLGTDGKVLLNPTKTQSNNPQVQQALQQFAKEQPVICNVSSTIQSAGIGSDVAEKLLP